MLTEITELEVRLARQLTGDRGDDDLTAVSDAHQARGPIRCAPVVVTVAQLDLTRVETHPHLEREVWSPGFTAQRRLRVDRRRQRVLGVGEHRHAPVSRRLHDVTG